MKRIALLSMTLALIVLTACNTWERNTFNTLASAKATLDTAQTEYEVSATSNTCPNPAQPGVACLPHTSGINTAITKAKLADKTAVDAMVAYELAKAAGTDKAGLDALQAEVTAALSQLDVLIADVRAFQPTGGSK